MRIAREEVFGPFTVVLPFDDERRRSASRTTRLRLRRRADSHVRARPVPAMKCGTGITTITARPALLGGIQGWARAIGIESFDEHFR